MNIDKIWKRKVRRATAKLLREGSVAKIETVNVPCAVVISTNNHITNLQAQVDSLLEKGTAKPIQFKTSVYGMAALYQKNYTNLFAVLENGSCVKVIMCNRSDNKICFQTYLAGFALQIHPEYVTRLYEGNPNA